MTPAGAHKRDVAKGAGIVALSRLGALVEVVSQPAYVWMFGVALYGVYTVLWAAVNTLSNMLDMAMTTALQRIVPQARSEEEAHSALKIALIVGVTPSILVGVAAMLLAGELAPLVNAGPEAAARMETAILIFAPALPLWTFIEVATSAVRARRAFGPEVRLRLFWEQCVRLGIAFALFLAGWDTLALVTAHVGSLAVTALLAMRLIGRYYDLGMLARAPLDRAVARDLLSSGLGILPSNAAQRFFIDLPPLVLNAIIPGNAGAIAAGLFGIARKIATVPQLVRQVFLYVLAPLASAQAAADRSGIAPLYAFATRLSTIAVIPLAAFICLIGEEILRLFSPAAATALPILVVLVVGRGVEAVVGPASPVVEMIGHKLLPTLNSLAGLALWAGIAAWRVPIDGAVGMGWAVAAGVVLRSWLAVAELRISDGFRPFRGRFVLCLSLGALGAAALSLVDTLMSGGNTWLEVAVLAVFLCATIWTGLRFGLTRSDREALGIVGVKLGLFPALPAS